MSYEVTKPADLLSAYLSRDLAPDERAVVERLLKEDVLAAEQLDDLRELAAMLKEVDREVSQTTIDSLRRIVWQKIQEKQIKALVTVSITGDLTNKENTDVQAYLNVNPAAQLAQREAAQTSEFLNAGNRTADATMADKLRAKLKIALPAAVLTSAPKTELTSRDRQGAPLPLSSKTDSSAVLTPERPVSARTQRPSLRVFVKPENPWKKRIIMASGIAALLAITFGARAWWRSGTAQTNPIVKQDGPPVKTHEIVDTIPPREQGSSHGEAVKVVPQEALVAPRDSSTPPKSDIVNVQPKPPIPGSDNPPKVDQQVVIEPQKSPLNPPNPLNPRQLDGPKVPSDTVQKDIKNVSPATQDKINEIVPKSILPDNNQTAGPNQYNGPKNGTGVWSSIVGPNGATPGSGLAAVPKTPPTTSERPPKGPNESSSFVPTEGNNAITPQADSGVVGSIKGNGGIVGIVTVTSPTGTISVPQQNGTIASGSKIVTDGKMMMSLVLPDNGRLYIQTGSDLIVTFGKITSIVLNSGEIYYIAPKGGSLNLSAGKAQATKVIEGDVNLNAGRLVVLNNGDALSLSSPKNKINVANGEEGSAAADGSDAPKKDNPIQLVSNGNWRAPILLANDPPLKKSRKR